MTLPIAPLPETAAPPVPDGGLGALSTGRGNLPLDSVDVHASIAGLAASIEVVQGFHNPYDVPLEATYIFPLPDRAAVTALRMEAADRVVDGVLKERGQARREYDAAISSGRRAAIAEEDRPDVFTMRVGNILPGERVTVRLTLNQPLPYEADVPAPGAATGAGTTADTTAGTAADTGEAGGGGSATFRFPLVVAPRYIPGAPLEDDQAGSGVAADTDAVPDASRISPPVLLPGFPNPVRLSITVDVDPAGLALTGLRSALHVVAEGESGDRTRISLRPGERLNRDFILRLDYASGPSSEPVLALTPDTGEGADARTGSTESTEGTFTLTVMPSGETRPRPRDIVLLLDRSGSMGGWKMIAARRAAGRIVDTFTAGDRFAVLSFDHGIERPRDLGAGLVPGTDRNRFRAVEHLAGLGARGGTEMLRPLEEACGLLADPSRDRVLVLITDGQIGNEDQILAGLVPRLNGVRVHTVGIDRAVNAGFLGRLAEAGQGRFELVESEDRLDEAMERIHHRIGSPLVTELRLFADEGLEIVPDTVAPRRIGALFPGVPLVVSGRFRGRTSGNILVRGTTPEGRNWERRVTGTVTEAPAAAAIWARAHLRDLEDRYAVSGSGSLESRILETSLRFNVLCRFTAFVAVDSRVVTEGGDPHQVVQPVETPDGWAVDDSPDYLGGPQSAPRMAAPMAYGAAPPPAAAPAPPGYGAPPPAPSSQGSLPPAAPSADMDWMESEQSRGGGGPARGSARGRLPRPAGRPGGRPSAPPSPPGSAQSPAERDLAEARRQFGRLLQDLRGMATDTREARQAYLLGSALPTLDTFTRAMQASGVDAAFTTPLSVLVNDLKALGWAPGIELVGQADASFDALWDRTIQTLDAFVQQGDEEKDKPGRRAFWKRSR
ncbi:VIT domain-containing protein [Spirillospora sp. CA-255316]